MSFFLTFFVIWLIGMAPISIGWWFSGGQHRWHERYACPNCSRITPLQTIPSRCPSCGSPAGRSPVVVRRLLPFVWEQLDEDEARTGIKAKPTSLWSRLFGGAA